MGEFPVFVLFDFDRADVRETDFWAQEAERRIALRELELIYSMRIAFTADADLFKREYTKLSWRLKAFDFDEEYPTKGAKD